MRKWSGAMRGGGSGVMEHRRRYRRRGGHLVRGDVIYDKRKL